MNSNGDVKLQQPNQIVGQLQIIFDNVWSIAEREEEKKKRFHFVKKGENNMLPQKVQDKSNCSVILFLILDNRAVFLEKPNDNFDEKAGDFRQFGNVIDILT